MYVYLSTHACVSWCAGVRDVSAYSIVLCSAPHIPVSRASLRTFAYCVKFLKHGKCTDPYLK